MLILHGVEYGGDFMDIIKISDAEYEIMEIIWSSDEELSAKDMMNRLDKDNDWKHTTVLTLANRLVDKNVLKVRKEKRINYYSARLSKDEYKSYQADGFIEDMYDGSVKSLVASLYNNKKIEKEELDELRTWIRGL